MGQAYTPGLQVTKHTRVVKVRELPLPGRCLVKKGARVKANDQVLSAELPGDLDVIRVAARMGFDPQDVVPGMKVASGDSVQAGDLLCEVKTFFGLFTSRLTAPRGGVVEFFTESNAHLGLRQPSTPLNVEAYISGTITGVDEGKSVTIETDAALLQGIFGVGGERLGTLLALSVANDVMVSADDLRQLNRPLRNTILVGGAGFELGALQEAAEQGVAAVVTGSIDAETLSAYVGYEIGVSITGDEEVPCTVIVTEGFGLLPIAERIMLLARELDGQAASVTGATQVRAGAMRPEVIVPTTDAETENQAAAEASQLTLNPGSRIRVIRVPYFGQLGTVADLPSEKTEIPSGASVRVLKAKLDDGREVIVPRANVELVQV